MLITDNASWKNEKEGPTAAHNSAILEQSGLKCIHKLGFAMLKWFGIIEPKLNKYWHRSKEKITRATSKKCIPVPDYRAQVVSRTFNPSIGGHL